MSVHVNRLSSLYHSGCFRLAAYPLHSHDFGEISWIDEGTCTHFVNDEQFMLKPGDLLLIRPSDQHSFRAPSKKTFSIYNVAFDWDLYRHIKGRYLQNNEALYGEDLATPKTIPLSKQQLQIFRLTFLSLLKMPKTHLRIEGFLLNIFSELFDLETDLSEQSNDERLLPSWLRYARHAIRDPERLRLGVQEFYRLCGRCPEHVTRTYHRFLGETPGEHIHRLRMEHAAVLLTGTANDIVDVSLACGFQSLSHFYAGFRKIYKTSPRRYRIMKQGRMY